MRKLTMVAARRALPLVVAAAALAACARGDDLLAPELEEPIYAGGESTTSPSAAVVGTWRRTVIFTSEGGSLVSSETVWTFDATGQFVRRITARDHSTGFSDVQFSSGRWRTDGGALEVTFDGPGGGTIRLAFQLGDGGRVLVLGGQEFEREVR